MCKTWLEILEEAERIRQEREAQYNEIKAKRRKELHLAAEAADLSLDGRRKKKE